MVTPDKYEDIVIANPPRSFFQNFSFQNKVLRRNGTWQGCASYQTEEGKIISGKLNISANDFMLNVSPAFSPRRITGKLLADPKAISITNDSVTLRCKNGTYTFLLASDVAASLREWFDEKKEAFYIISNMSNSVLADYASFPHPFTEQHAKKDADKYQIFRYLGGYIPELFEPFRWNCTDISMQINEEVTDIKFDYYRYRETKDSITYDHDEVCIGFFDDSGIDIHFHLEIRYLGEDIPAEDQAKVNNEMLGNCFWKETIFAPRISVEPFIAKDPFGLQGYYSFRSTANRD